jgi:hypothetical protein
VTDHKLTEKKLAEATALLIRVQTRGPTRGDGALNGDINAFLGWAGKLEPAPPQHHCGVSGWRPDLGDAPCPACEKAEADYRMRVTLLGGV